MSFAALHHGDEPFVLPNAWDAGSARLLCGAGFAAVATTSMGISASAGHPDGTRSGSDGVDPIVRVLRANGVFVNVDFEDGYSADPAVVAERALTIDADGVNLEDDTDQALVPVELMVAKIEAVKAARPELFVNARPDTYYLGSDSVSDFLDRAHAYVTAGADGIFLQGTNDPDVIATVAREVDAPLNVLAHPTLTRAQLGDLGVRRISTGSVLYRSAMAAALAAATAVRDGEALPPAMPYDEVQAIMSDPPPGG